MTRNMIAIARTVNVGTRCRSEFNASEMKCLVVSITDNTTFTICRDELVVKEAGGSF